MCPLDLRIIKKIILQNTESTLFIFVCSWIHQPGPRSIGPENKLTRLPNGHRPSAMKLIALTHYPSLEEASGLFLILGPLAWELQPTDVNTDSIRAVSIHAGQLALIVRHGGETWYKLFCDIRCFIFFSLLSLPFSWWT